MDITPIQSFYNYTFNRIGETGSYLVNTGAGFTAHPGILMIGLLPFGQPLGIGTIPETGFKIIIQGSALTGAGVTPKMSDRVLFRGIQYSFAEQDPVTLSINGTPLAYSFLVAG